MNWQNKIEKAYREKFLEDVKLQPNKLEISLSNGSDKSSITIETEPNTIRILAYGVLKGWKKTYFEDSRLKGGLKGNVVFDFPSEFDIMKWAGGKHGKLIRDKKIDFNRGLNEALEKLGGQKIGSIKPTSSVHPHGIGYDNLWISTYPTEKEELRNSNHIVFEYPFGSFTSIFYKLGKRGKVIPINKLWEITLYHRAGEMGHAYMVANSSEKVKEVVREAGLHPESLDVRIKPVWDLGGIYVSKTGPTVKIEPSENEFPLIEYLKELKRS